MDPMKLDVLFAFFSYGGNGGINMLLPELLSWFHGLGLQLRDDPRIGRFGHKRFGDVPLTMERNRAVATAKEGGFDVLVMLDSDNVPDLYSGFEGTQPFFWSSFDFLYERKQRGMPSVILAPYCGPPPHPTNGGMENIYVFYAEDRETDNIDSGFSFEAYSRQQAATMRGIREVAAGPTGCCMYTLDAFDLMPIEQLPMHQILELHAQGELTTERACRLLSMQSWFFYEYTDRRQTAKASTEDVTNTREIQLAGQAKLGEPVVFCNWDAWAGHYKPKLVGRPTPVGVQEINACYQEAMERHLKSTRTKTVDVDFTDADIAQKAAEVDGKKEEFAFPMETNVEVNWRLIKGRKVASVGHMTSDADLDGLDRLVSLLAKHNHERPLRIVELGSWVGESAIAMHQALGPAGGVIYCVDHFNGSNTDLLGEFASTLTPEKVRDYFCQNVGDLLDDRIKLIEGEAVQVGRQYSDPQGVDLLFVDASHDYHSVSLQLETWIRHVDIDGVVCGHDWHDDFPGVKRAVKEMCDQYGTAPNLIDGTNIWVVRKRDLMQKTYQDNGQDRESNEHDTGDAQADTAGQSPVQQG